MTAQTCRACGSDRVEVFHTQESVPANSCLLVSTSAEAEDFPRGRIDLGFCAVCGFIGNLSFSPELTEYSTEYEETQAFSAKFVEFAGALATEWVEKYQLRGKHVIEIGCGKGEFLVMLADAGIGSGLGIDPGVNTARIPAERSENLEWSNGLFDSEYGPLVADAVVCRHTLEHIPNVRDFLDQIRAAIGDRTETVLLFELPDTARVLEEAAFWDVYYEHCSYFSEGSLARLFERCGFEVLNVSLAYEDQYLILEAKPVPGGRSSSEWPADDMDQLETGVVHFASSYRDIASRWRDRLEVVVARGGKSVIWGASSKGVSFLSVVGDLVEAAVDINPNKWGTYMAGTGHKIVGPDDLLTIDPHLVVVMNPIYLGEIREDLESRGISSEVVTL